MVLMSTFLVVVELSRGLVSSMDSVMRELTVTDGLAIQEVAEITLLLTWENVNLS